MKQRTFYLHTMGCQMNVYDGQRIINMLSSRGLIQTDIVAEADVIILNTCSVREKATEKVFSELGRIRKAKRPEAVFGITGCVAREEGKNAFSRIQGLNFVLGPQSYHKLIEVVLNPDAVHLHIDLSGLEKYDAMPEMTTSELVAYIPVQEGCSHACTYCIVPYTRGPEVSRPFDDCLNDARRAVDLGAKEICFLGQNVNGYKYNLAAMIREVAKLDGVRRIRYTSSYPTEMTDELIELHGTEEKLLPFLNLPLQSGSQAVLRRMNRPYNIDEYLNIIERLAAARPDIKISSDFIVGFPGETDDDFRATCDIARRVGFINSYSFKYSKRPHTAAAKMPDQIPEAIKKERLRVLDGILNDNQRAFNESCIGREFECLFERMDGRGNAIYRTPHMVQVIVPSSVIHHPSSIIKITSGNKSSLRGEICQ